MPNVVLNLKEKQQKELVEVGMYFLKDDGSVYVAARVTYHDIKLISLMSNNRWKDTPLQDMEVKELEREGFTKIEVSTITLT